jgi:hypothetical protein
MWPHEKVLYCFDLREYTKLFTLLGEGVKDKKRENFY